jgi:hypothetical protein
MMHKNGKWKNWRTGTLNNPLHILLSGWELNTLMGCHRISYVACENDRCVGAPQSFKSATVKCKVSLSMRLSLLSLWTEPHSEWWSLKLHNSNTGVGCKGSIIKWFTWWKHVVQVILNKGICGLQVWAERNLFWIYIILHACSNTAMSSRTFDTIMMKSGIPM